MRITLALRAALLSVAFMAGCAPHTTSDRRRVPRYRKGSLDVIELSATDALQRMAAGTLTSRALTQAYLDRIAIHR